MGTSYIEPGRGKRIPALVLFALLSAAGCQGPATPRLVEQSALAMGSSLRVAVWTARESDARAAIAQVFAEFDRLEAALSVWREGSDVQRLNAAAGGAPVPIGADTRAVLAAALAAGRLTGGKFDITFGALADLWRFDHDQDNLVPAADRVAARLPLVDFTAVQVDEGAGTARIERPGVRVHLGGIGKGYALDRAAALLRAAGFEHFLLQAGGDLYAAGQRGTRPWRVGVNDPRGAPDDSFATIELRDETFSTSGDYERFFITDGVRYHHLLDPDTGEPARGCRSVTVLAPRALDADWLSTGIFILGPEAGLALAEQLPGVEALIVAADNIVTMTSGLEERVTILRAPTP